VGNARFSDDFKRDAVEQIVDRGYPVAEVSKRLGVSTHSLYGWMKKLKDSSNARKIEKRGWRHFVTPMQW